MRRRSLALVSRLAPLLAGLLLCAAGADAAKPALSRFAPPVYEAAPGSPAKLLARHGDGTLFFTDRGVTLNLASGQRVTWGLAGLERAPVAAQPQSTLVHELVGSETQNRSGLKTWSAVRYPDALNGTELLVVSKAGGYAWSLHAPSPAAVEGLVLRYGGVEKLTIDLERSLLVARLDGAELRESGLACRQPREDGSARAVRCVYGPAVRTGERQWDYSVRVFDADPALPLIIDPDVTWAGRIGGSQNDRATAVSWNEQQRVVLVAATVASSDFQPNTPRAGDVVLLRVQESGDALASVTYLGGSTADYSRALFIGPAGRIYLAGVTTSDDLPARADAWIEDLTVDPLAVSYGFVCALAPDASSVVRCTYLGGNGTEEIAGLAYSIISGELFVAGSSSAPLFHGKTAPSKRNVVAVSLTDELESSPRQLVFGGGGDDVAHAVAADSSGYFYVGGSTDGTFDGSSVPGLQKVPAGGTDGFLLRINAIHGGLDAWTLLGGTEDDAVRAILTSDPGTLYVLGDTASADGAGTLAGEWPVKGTDLDTTVVERDLFLSRLSSNLSGVTWSMLLGGSEDEQAAALAMHPGSDRLYLAGSRLGIVSGLPRADLPGRNHFDEQDEGPSEVILGAVEGDGTFVWSTYFGGIGGEEAGALAVRSDHTLLLAGATVGQGFPVTPGAIDEGSGTVDSDVFFAAIPGDLTPPTAGTVRDGPHADEELDEQFDTENLSANWDGFSDPESGIVKYRAALGTAPDNADVVPFGDVDEAGHTFTGLTLQPGTTYYVLVRATNGAGDTVGAASDGITIVAAPDAGTPPDAGPDAGTDPGGSDAGGEPDAGTPGDSDGGTGTEPEPVSPGPVLGWRCAAGGASGAMPGLLAMLAAAVLARRRRS